MSAKAFTRAVLMTALCTLAGAGCGGMEEEVPSQAPAAEALGTAEASMSPPPFTCGPHTLTYAVLNTDSPPKVVGIRCVKVVNNHSFAWYGEGRWGSFTYRHVGYAAGDNFNGGVNFRGSMADIHGNGENATGFFNQNLAIRASIPISQGAQTIDVLGGGINERWTLATLNTTQYAQLPFDMTKCGNGNLDQLKLQGFAPEQHVRCLLDLKLGTNLPYVWVGKGTLSNGQPYFHLGTGNFQLGGGWGLSDLCLTGSHACNNIDFGRLSLTRMSNGGGILVTGAITEVWLNL